MGKVKKPYIFTQTRTKTNREKKDIQIQAIRDSLDDYPFVYIVEYIKGSLINELRLKLQDTSKIFCVKHKVCSVAFSQISQHSNWNSITLMSPYLKKERFVMFSNQKPDSLGDFFLKEYENDAPVPGAECPSTLVLKPGKIEGLFWYDEEFFALNSIPIKIKERELYVTDNYTVCKKGNILSSQQAKILNKLKDTPISDDPNFPWVTYRFRLISGWSRETNKIMLF